MENINENKRKIVARNRTLVLLIVISLYILSERCSPFYWLDTLHIKHYLTWAVLFLYGLPMIYAAKTRKFKCLREAQLFIVMCIVLYAISLFFQIKNDGFKLYALEEIYYLLIPFLIGFFAINYLSLRHIDILMTTALAVALFSFFLTRIFDGRLSIANFISVFDVRKLFLYSTSPLGESDLSVCFLVLFIYFVFRKSKFRAFLSALGCILGYKRFAVLYLIFLLIAIKFLFKAKKVNKAVFYTIMIFFILAPFATYYVCTDEFANWFYEQFNVDFNAFTMTRFYIINTVIDADLVNYGLGTVTDFLEKRGAIGQTNMHNDILRIYMETTIIGTIVFTRNFFQMCRSNWYSYLTIVFMFFELLFAHFIGPGTISFWIVAYLAIFAFNVYQPNKSLEEKAV